jgi:hypothetical protein
VELDHRLFWLQEVSDEFLDQLYTQATALLAASEAEGFGLPLIEAAKHGLPIIARDIPIFREVARDFAYYFQSHNSQGLAVALANWLELHRQGRAPASRDLPWLTWKESVRNLLVFFQTGEDAAPSLSKTGETAGKSLCASQVFRPPSMERNGDLMARLVERQARLNTPLEENTEKGVNGSGLFLDYLTEGWSQPEDWGVWTEGGIAQMEFCIDPGQKTTHMLSLEGRAFVDHQKHPAITVNALLNGRLAGTCKFTSEASTKRLEIFLGNADPGGRCQVRLQIAEPRSPLDLGLSGDGRKLGFGLQKMKFCRIPPT